MLWISPKFEGPRKPTAQWIQCVFEFVVQYLLGWSLDLEKSQVHDHLAILGLEIEMEAQESSWVVSPDKAEAWIADIDSSPFVACRSLEVVW